MKSVEDFTYLGSRIISSDSDIQVRKAKAWSALNKMDKVWKSSLPLQMKRRFFSSVVESVLLYGSTTWTLTKIQESRLDGCYTRMLRAALNLSWKEHPTKQQLYGNLPPISHKIRDRRLRFAGHCYRSKGELVSDVLLWQPQHGKQSVGAPRRNYIKQLTDDTDCCVEDLPVMMANRDAWRELVNSVRAVASNR